MEPVDLEEEELETRVEDISVHEVEPIFWLPPYMFLRKPTARVTKDPDAVKFSICTPLMLEDAPFEGALLVQVPQLHMEDWDLAIRAKFPHFELRKYPKIVYYEDVGVT